MKLLIILLLSVIGFNSHQNQEFNGTWISEEDPNWKMVFTQDECKWYYENELTENYYFSISNSTPQCGYEVPVESTTSYLKFISKDNSNDIICYEINGFAETTPGRKTLSIRAVGRGGHMLFIKQ